MQVWFLCKAYMNNGQLSLWVCGSNGDDEFLTIVGSVISLDGRNWAMEGGHVLWEETYYKAIMISANRDFRHVAKNDGLWQSSEQSGKNQHCQR